MNKLGINLWNWIEQFSDSNTNLFPMVKKMGYDLVEFGLDDLTFDPYAVRRVADDCGLEISLCAVLRNGRDISSSDEVIRASTKEYLKRCFEYAYIMGAETIGGAVYAGGGRARMLPAQARSREWGLAVEGLREIAGTAKDCGVTVCIEPLNRYKTDMVNKAAEARRMAQDIGEPCFKVLFDTYQAGIEEKNLPNAILAVGEEFMGHFHASENDRGCPGTGQLDWKGCFDALERIHYKGAIVVESFCVSPRDSVWKPTELTQDMLAEKAIRFLKDSLGG